jgi:catechol 2,3-dioxygenase-like lactoylglutathione lyase family enzyme
MGIGTTGLDHVGLSVRDVDQMSDWYCAALEMTVQARFDYPLGRRAVRGALLVAETGWRVELQECEGSTPGHADSVPASLLRQGLGHLCVRVEDLDEAYALLLDRGAGAVFPPTASPLPGMRVAYASDPEGNFVELLEERAPSDA